MIMNFCFLIINCNYRPDIKQIIFKPLICAVIGVGISAFIYNTMYASWDAKITTLISIIVAVIIYFITIFLFKGIEKEDIEMLPKGKKIAKLFQFCI